MGVKVFWRWPNLTTLGEWPMNQHKLEYQFNYGNWVGNWMCQKEKFTNFLYIYHGMIFRMHHWIISRALGKRCFSWLSRICSNIVLWWSRKGKVSAYFPIGPYFPSLPALSTRHSDRQYNIMKNYLPVQDKVQSLLKKCPWGDQSFRTANHHLMSLCNHGW